MPCRATPASQQAEAGYLLQLKALAHGRLPRELRQRLVLVQLGLLELHAALRRLLVALRGPLHRLQVPLQFLKFLSVLLLALR
jgi:hypothetical protein